MKNYALPIAKPGFDPDNEKQMRAAVERALQDLSQVNEGGLAFTDITMANADATKHGLMPKLPNDASKYLDGTGHYTTPATTTGLPVVVDWNFLATPQPLSRSGWTASASAVAGGAAANAIDGNTATRWATGAVVTPGTTYFELQLAAAQTISGFRMDNYADTGDFPQTGNVQWSDDGASWTTIGSWTAANLSSGGAVLSGSWTGASHLYWRWLAESTPSVGTNWWSIYEINLFRTSYVVPSTHAANETWTLGPQQSITLHGTFARISTADQVSIGIGTDVNNYYGLFYDSASSNVLLSKWVAGTRTTLATLGIDNDTNPHEFQLVVLTPNGTGQSNWVLAWVGRATNPPVSAGVLDGGVDLTGTGTGTFPLLATTDTIARGCFAVQLPATQATDAQCTWATGGDYVYQDGAYRVHAFYTSGTFRIAQAGVGILDVYAIAGGGGASGLNGGGAGGYTNTQIPLAVGATTVTVGAGGTGVAGGSASAGANSSFGVIGATGGGGATSGAGGSSTGSHTGGTGTGVSGSCANSPPTSFPCTAGFSAGGGGASPLGNGTNAAITGNTFDCATGTCVASGTWGAGGPGTHLAIANHNPGTYSGFDVCTGGYGAGTSSGTGTVSGPSAGGSGGESLGYGGTNGGTGGNGLVLVRYLYNPANCG